MAQKAKRAPKQKPGKAKPGKVKPGKPKPGKAKVTKAKQAPKSKAKRRAPKKPLPVLLPPPPSGGVDASVLDALFRTVVSRKTASPATSHSARLLARGTAKVAQKLGEEAVETVIEATRGNRDAVVTESADLLYHLIVVWVDAGVQPAEVWTELRRREGTSGIAEKAARAVALASGPRTRKVW